MNTESNSAAQPGVPPTARIHKWLTLFLQLTLLIGALLAIVQGRWLAAIVTGGIIVVTLLPLILGRRSDVQIPPEFEVLAVVFIYASLFLGEVHATTFDSGGGTPCFISARDSGSSSFLERWIAAFIAANPRLFSRWDGDRN